MLSFLFVLWFPCHFIIVCTSVNLVTARRVGNGEEVVLSWTFTDKKVNRVNIYYRVKDSGTWILWKDNVQKMNDTISDVSLDKVYQFRVEMLYSNEVTGMGVVVEGRYKVLSLCC